MTRDECILLGSITKTHGVRGELILRTGKVSFEPEQNWGTVFLEIDGILVPFSISALANMRERDWLISFYEVTDKNKAESITGLKVWVSRDLIDEGTDELFYDQLAGFTLTDKISGKSGTIIEYLDIPGNPVFDVNIEGENHLIPAQEEFIVEFDVENRFILMNLPSGLL
jgi:16S rRNA processing protein RimM